MEKILMIHLNQRWHNSHVSSNICFCFSHKSRNISLGIRDGRTALEKKKSENPKITEFYRVEKRHITLGVYRQRRQPACHHHYFPWQAVLPLSLPHWKNLVFQAWHELRYISFSELFPRKFSSASEQKASWWKNNYS